MRSHQALCLQMDLANPSPKFISSSSWATRLKSRSPSDYSSSLKWDFFGANFNSCAAGKQSSNHRAAPGNEEQLDYFVFCPLEFKHFVSQIDQGHNRIRKTWNGFGLGATLKLVLSLPPAQGGLGQFQGWGSHRLLCQGKKK